MSNSLSYAVVTPARNEATNLRRLAGSLFAQRAVPLEWVIVDDGSTDGTDDLARELATQRGWVTAIHAPSQDRPVALERGRLSGRPVIAFKAGLVHLRTEPDIVVKLDADVTFGDDFFELLVRAFEDDPTLGIAGGTCLELTAGSWREVHITGDTVRGATRAYRWACLQDVMPLPECMGWDGIDAVKAKLHGWRTRTLRELPAYHHRPMGLRDGSGRKGWDSQGRAAYYMGYRPSYVLFRSLFHTCRSSLDAFAMVTGYTSAALRHEPRHPDRAVIDALREQQRVRHLHDRLREKLGRRPDAPGRRRRRARGGLNRGRA